MGACLWPHQSSRAEQNHKNDECLKPVVFNNEVASFPQEPPVLSPALGDGHVTAFVSCHTGWKTYYTPTEYTFTSNQHSQWLCLDGQKYSAFNTIKTIHCLRIYHVKEIFDYLNPTKVILEVNTNWIKTWSIPILVALLKCSIDMCNPLGSAPPHLILVPSGSRHDRRAHEQGS